MTLSMWNDLMNFQEEIKEQKVKNLIWSGLIQYTYDLVLLAGCIVTTPTQEYQMFFCNKHAH